MTEPETAYVGLGTNLGDRAATIVSAIDALDSAAGVRVTARSAVLETDPVGPVRQGKFLNAVVEVATTLTPQALIATCLAIERQHGRKRETERRWGPRSLDLDLLLHGEHVVDEPGLTLPHPRMHTRAFVLDPLAEIAPELIHPVLGRSIRELRDRGATGDGGRSTAILPGSHPVARRSGRMIKDGRQ